MGEQSHSLQLTCVYLITSTGSYQLYIAIYINHHRCGVLTYLCLKSKCRKQQQQQKYITIGHISIKVRSQKEFHKPNDRSSSIYGTVRVLIKEDCLSNLTALLHLVEELSINLPFFKNCRKGKRRHSILAMVKNVQIQAAYVFPRELILVLL